MIPPRIVVFQTAFLGDVILTIPLLTAIRRSAPGTETALVTIPSAAPLVQGHPDVTQVIVYDKHGNDRGFAGAARVIRALRQWNAGLAFVPHRSLRSALAIRLAGIPRRIGFTTSAGSFLFTDRVRYRKNAHEIDRNLDLLDPLDLRPQERILPTLHPNARDAEIVEQMTRPFFDIRVREPIAVAPGSVWPTKRWVPEGYVKVCRMLAARGEPVVLIGGESDADLCAQIAARAGPGVYSFAGSLSLMQSAAMVKASRILLTNDSAPQHLAVALGIPVVSIFGPTVTSFGFAPVGPYDEVVETPGLPCRPCSIHGGEKCPIGTFDCMNHILPEHVLAALDRVAERAKTSARTTDH